MALSLHTLHTLQPDREKKISTSASSAEVALSLHTLQPLSLHTLQPLGARPAAPCARALLCAPVVYTELKASCTSCFSDTSSLRDHTLVAQGLIHNQELLAHALYHTLLLYIGSLRPHTLVAEGLIDEWLKAS